MKNTWRLLLHAAFSKCALLLFLTMANAQNTLPQIPSSERIITAQQVKNFWLHRIINSPFPPEPNGLHRQKKAQWNNLLSSRKQILQDIRTGVYDEQARIAQLRHNSNAWRLKGNDEEADKLIKQLYDFKRAVAEIRNSGEGSTPSTPIVINVNSDVSLRNANHPRIRSWCGI